MLNFLLSHLYFTLDILILLAIWLPFYLLNKQNKKWVMIMSFFGIWCGLPPVADTYLKDYWSPVYIYPNAWPRIEDVLFCFALVGIMASIYLYFKNKYNNHTETSNTPLIFNIGATVLIFSVYFLMVYVFNISSYYGTIICSGLIALYSYYKIPKDIRFALYTGLIISVTYIPIYLIGLYLNPDFINNEWMSNSLSGLAIAGIPIEEFILYISMSVGICSILEILKNSKLPQLNKN